MKPIVITIEHAYEDKITMKADAFRQAIQEAYEGGVEDGRLIVYTPKIADYVEEK